jgi:hypothetical protein
MGSDAVKRRVQLPAAGGEAVDAGRVSMSRGKPCAWVLPPYDCGINIIYPLHQILVYA